MTIPDSIIIIIIPKIYIVFSTFVKYNTYSQDYREHFCVI